MQNKLTESPTPVETPAHLKSPVKKRSSARYFFWLLIVAAAVGGYLYWHGHQSQTASAAQGQAGGAGGGGGRRGGAGGPVPVVVAAAVRQDLPVFLDGLGSVTALNTVTVKSRVDGELVEVDFKEGQDVHKGDLLAVIDPRPYQVVLSQAQASLAQAQANLVRDQAMLADAKLNAGRYLQLVKDGIIPQQQSDTQGALAAQLTGTVAADQASIQSAQAAIDSAKLNLVYTRITSPVDGRVGLRLVDQGNIVHATDASGLLLITQMEPITVVSTLPEDALPQVTAGMRRGGMPVRAMTRDNGTLIATGSLLTIDNTIDQTTGTFRLKSVFENKDRVLWPNQFVNARLLLDTKKDAVVIASAALQTSPDGSFVYLLKPDKTVAVRPVKVGITEGTLSSIDSGVAPGDVVVTDGQDRLQAGARVDARFEQQAGGAGAAGAPASAASDSPSGEHGPKSADGRQGPSNGHQRADGEGGGDHDHGGGGKRAYGQNGGQQGFKNGSAANAGQYSRP